MAKSPREELEDQIKTEVLKKWKEAAPILEDFASTLLSRLIAARTYNPYGVLNLTDAADEPTVKAMYRALVQVHSPDKPTGNEESFKKLQAAYEAIKEERGWT